MITTSAPIQTGLYLYGITVADPMRGKGDSPHFPERPDGCFAEMGTAPFSTLMPCSLCGVGGADVELVVEGNLAAIVSQLGAGKIRPQRANLAAHHRILHDLAEDQPVLPVVFGTITGNEEQLRRILRRNESALSDLLDRLQGKVEMGLKVYWDLPNVFEYFVATHQELESMRNRLFRPGRTPTVEEKVELGERFVSLLQQARARHTQRVKEALAAYSVEVRSTDPGEERMILKLACLVEKNRQGQWEEGVRQAAMFFDDHYRFDYNGPWPPYNFADVDLRLS